MNETLPNENDLLRYLDGEMTADEKTAFEARLQKDPVLKQELEKLSVAIAGVRQFGTAQKLHTIHAEMMKELRPSADKGRVVRMKRPFMVGLLAAASLVAIVVGIKMFSGQTPDADDLYRQAFVDYTVSGSRGRAQASQVENFYREKNYTAVMEASKKDSLSSADSLLTGISHLKTNDAAGAIVWLQNIRSEASKPDAEFYLSLALLKARHFSESGSLMKKIQADPNHPYHAQFTKKMISDMEALHEK